MVKCLQKSRRPGKESISSLIISRPFGALMVFNMIGTVAITPTLTRIVAVRQSHMMPNNLSCLPGAPVLGYGSEPCPYWSKSRVWSEYGSRCPHGHRCPYSHGSKEQLYHPSYYKTMPCRVTSTVLDIYRHVGCDWKSRGKCPRGELCAFYHHTSERRTSKRYHAVLRKSHEYSSE